MINKKLTKEQLKAVEDLALNLDEINNKPHRFFSALEDFALLFKKDEMLDEVLANVYELERGYYKYLRLSGVLIKFVDSFNEVDREMIVRDYKTENEDFYSGYRHGVRRTNQFLLNTHSRLILNILQDNYE